MFTATISLHIEASNVPAAAQARWNGSDVFSSGFLQRLVSGLVARQPIRSQQLGRIYTAVTNCPTPVTFSNRLTPI